MIQPSVERTAPPLTVTDLAAPGALPKGVAAGSFDRELEAALAETNSAEAVEPGIAADVGADAPVAPGAAANLPGAPLPGAGSFLPPAPGASTEPAPDAAPAAPASHTVTPAAPVAPIIAPAGPGTNAVPALPVAAVTLPIDPAAKLELPAAQLPRAGAAEQTEPTAETLVAPTKPSARGDAAGLPPAAPPPSAEVQPPAAQSASAQTNSAAPTSTAPPSAAPASPSAPPTLATEVKSDPRIAPQIEAAIEQLADTRQAARSARPEILMRHADFGLVSLRLDASSGDLRATLAARDPGFIPAVQAALVERAIAASSETATGQRGPDQQSGSGTGGAGQSLGQNYGSSPGSSQGSPQPRLHHHAQATSERGERASEGARSDQPMRDGTDEVFA
jgi:hypothetical protein